ncbi:MAG: ATP-binding cassette domain-containing protein, partial [Candidatus Thiodiazotropha sp.]
LGLGNRGQSSADKVSLGQTKRVAIARAIHAGAKILFLDEPLSGLDAPGLRSVLDLLKSLVDSHRLTLVIVEHVWNARHILPLADTLWTLDQGKLTQESNGSTTHSADDCPEHDGTGDIASLFPEYSLTRSLKLPYGAVLDVYRKPDADAGNLILEVRDLVVFRGKRLVIGTATDTTADAEGLSFNLQSGDLAILRAPNGWGKTTLLDAISGILPCRCSCISLNGIEISRMQVYQRVSTGLNYLRSDSKAFPSLAAGQVANLHSSRCALRMASELDHRKYGKLSGGERQRVRFDSIPRKLSGVYLMDEPFSALDHDMLSYTANLIQESVFSAFAATLIAVPLSQEGGSA